MKVLQLERYRIDLEEAITYRGLDFSALYMDLCSLHAYVKENRDLIRQQTVATLKGVLTSRRHTSQKQALFLYKEAANALAAIAVTRRADGSLAQQSISALQQVALSAGGNAHRAAAEALGSLPVNVRGPEINIEAKPNVPLISLADLLREQNITDPALHSPAGRSLVFSTDKADRLFVIKMARAQDSPQQLLTEAVWMHHLYSQRHAYGNGFEVPRPVTVDGSYVFRIEHEVAPLCRQIHPDGYAIGFCAHCQYFQYANGNLAAFQFKQTMFKNAWLLGRLTAAGIVHTAPIPLFHNRVQRNRRSDNGVYQWPRGGRLDRWLYSCRYPNFGTTGLRDLEHLIAFADKSQKLYEQIGTQILSMLLVAGSYFRNKDVDRVGLGKDGGPADARELFDEVLLVSLIEGIFNRYYEGFVGTGVSGELSIDYSRISSRMIEEMGVDRHMVEVLRAVDQKQMSDGEFRDFLLDRGFSEYAMADLSKGEKDIEILTGPHLGGFNDRISVPELIEFVALASALCMAGKYSMDSLPTGDLKMSPSACHAEVVEARPCHFSTGPVPSASKGSG